MNNNNIDKELIKEYIEKSSVTDLNLKIFLGLYSNYFKLQNSLKNNNIDQLNDYENQIYTFDNKSLNNRERIKIELDRITEKIKNEKNKDVLRYIKPDFEEIEQLLSLNDEMLNEFISYIKKKIVKIQICLGLTITFYQSAYELFINEYSKLQEDRKTK